MAQDAFNSAILLVYLGLIVLWLASMWKVFAKADQPGWAALVPIYNAYVMLKIGDNPGWYLLLMLVPLVNLYAFGKMYVGIARAFDKGIGWGVGLWFLPFVFFPLLGFGDATYHGGPGDSGAGGQPAV